MRTKNILKSLPLCLLFPLLLAGSPSKESSDFTVTATRQLPEEFQPGKQLTVRLEITPKQSLAEVTLTEIVPEGWRVIASAPAWKKEDERLIENVYTWKLSLRRLKTYRLCYILEVPWGVKLPKEFTGFLEAGTGKKILVQGASAISVKDRP
ncbi:MAG: hypothetical protein NC911_03895 [Candidatus Omnitrophica bacterium]|nr:hypothetical protein [Candidatus Omnitrophota bacterium]MCM8768810.1 hypothetical protein [Candidatus Omnitrophota bacterium]